MTVTAADNALITVADLRGSLVEPGPLGITSTVQDDLLQELINRASAEVEAYCNRRFLRADVEALRLPGQRGTNLRPPRTPIDVEEPIAISLDGQSLTVWANETDGDPTLKQVIVSADEPGVPSYFYRRPGWFGRAPLPILLSYTGGYDTIPGDLKEAVVMVTQTFHRHRQQLSDITSMPGGGPGGNLVNFRSDYIPMAALKTLDRYRVWTV